MRSAPTTRLVLMDIGLEGTMALTREQPARRIEEHQRGGALFPPQRRYCSRSRFWFWYCGWVRRSRPSRVHASVP